MTHPFKPPTGTTKGCCAVCGLGPHDHPSHLEPAVIRTGRKNGHTLYMQDGPEPSDNDTFIGAMGDPDHAQEIVLRWNQWAERDVLVRELEGSLSTARREAKYHKDAHAKLLAVKQPVVTDEGTKAEIERAYTRGWEAAVAVSKLDERPAVEHRRLVQPLKALAAAEEAIKDAAAQFAVLFEDQDGPVVDPPKTHVFMCIGYHAKDGTCLTTLPPRTP